LLSLTCDLLGFIVLLYKYLNSLMTNKHVVLFVLIDNDVT